MTGTGELLCALGQEPVERLADLGGTAPEAALAALERWDCRIDLIDVLPDGRFPDQPSPWTGPYRDRLLAAGADPGRIRIVSRAEELRPCDVVLSLRGFGDRWRIRHLEAVLSGLAHSDTRVILDLRKGQGGFPWLRTRGTSTPLSRFQDGGAQLTRVRFAPGPTAAGDTDDWPAVAAALAGPAGFVTGNGSHSFIFRPRDPGTLVVTFDNLDLAMTRRADRRPWGHDFIERQGWSMLGVMAQGWTWYRNPWVWAEFDRLGAEGFSAGSGGWCSTAPRWGDMRPAPSPRPTRAAT